MLTRTPFDAPTLTPLADLDLAQLPPGTTIERTIDGTIFYRANWLLCQRGDTLYYVGNDGAARELERLATLEQEIAGLLAEKQRLIGELMPPVVEHPKTTAKREKPQTRPASNKPLVRCAVDGCEVEKPTGTAIAMHRQRSHHEWAVRQLALPNGHSLKVDRSAAIVIWQATQTDELPAVEQAAPVEQPIVEAAPEVAPDLVPFTPA